MLLDLVDFLLLRVKLPEGTLDISDDGFFLLSLLLDLIQSLSELSVQVMQP